MRYREATHLVWVLDQDVLAVRLFHTHVRHSADDTPAVRKRDVQLGGKVHWASGDGAQDDMTRVVARVHARNESKNSQAMNNVNGSNKAGQKIRCIRATYGE